MTKSAVFLDANVLIYALDKTSQQHEAAVSILQSLLDKKASLYTSHHVIEEVLHITRKIQGENAKPRLVVKEISKMPKLGLIEPEATLDFAKRYATLSQRLKMGINDALLLQLMLDAKIKKVFSYDQKFTNQAEKLGIQSIV